MTMAMRSTRYLCVNFDCWLTTAEVNGGINFFLYTSVNMESQLLLLCLCFLDRLGYKVLRGGSERRRGEQAYLTEQPSNSVRWLRSTSHPIPNAIRICGKLLDTILGWNGIISSDLKTNINSFASVNDVVEVLQNKAYPLNKFPVSWRTRVRHHNAVERQMLPSKPLKSQSHNHFRTKM